MIKNHSKNFVIIKKARLCRNIFCKAFGFMFRFRKPEKALIFLFKNERKMALHMLFVFFPIDVLFLDKNKKIVDIKKNFKPFAYYASKVKAKYVVELPIGLLGKTKISDKIIF